MARSNWTGVITNAGSSLIAEWVNEKSLCFDSAATGSGTVAAEAMLAQTALVNRQQDASIIGAEQVSTGIWLKLRIAAGAVAYTLNQYGIWAHVADEASKLIALLQHEQGIPIPSAAESPDFSYTFFALISTSNTGTWSVNIDTSAVVTLDELNKAVAGKADLDPSGKISAAQLPEMNYDPAGSAAAVQASVDAHTGSKDNPHGVTAAQVGAATTEALNAHTVNRSNPHGVTAAQVGTMPVAGGAFAGHVSMPSLTLTNYGVPLEIGQFLDFHFPGSVADYNGRLHLGTDGHLYWGSTPLSVPDAQKSVAYAASAGNANTLGGLPASNFYTAANAPVVVGTYIGDAASERLINLGFTPKAVLVAMRGLYIFTDVQQGGLAVTGNPAGSGADLNGVILNAYGFIVGSSGSSWGSRNTNNQYAPYNYIAFR